MCPLHLLFKIFVSSSGHSKGCPIPLIKLMTLYLSRKVLERGEVCGRGREWEGPGRGKYFSGVFLKGR